MELNLLSSHDLLKFRIESPVIDEIIEGDAADIIIVVPIIIQFLDMFLLCLILRLLRVVQVQDIDLSNVTSRLDSATFTFPRRLPQSRIGIVMPTSTTWFPFSRL